VLQTFTGGLSSFTVFNMVAGFLKHSAAMELHGMSHVKVEPHATRESHCNNQGGDEDVATTTQMGSSAQENEPIIHPGSPYFDPWLRSLVATSMWRDQRPEELPHYVRATLKTGGDEGPAADGSNAARGFLVPCINVTHPPDRVHSAVTQIEKEWLEMVNGPDLGVLLFATLWVRSSPMQAADVLAALVATGALHPTTDRGPSNSQPGCCSPHYLFSVLPFPCRHIPSRRR
jgi:hypothetical protein